MSQVQNETPEERAHAIKMGWYREKDPHLDFRNILEKAKAQEKEVLIEMQSVSLERFYSAGQFSGVVLDVPEAGWSCVCLRSTVDAQKKPLYYLRLDQIASVMVIEGWDEEEEEEGP